MLYSSGTTGRPKGIVPRQIDVARRFGDVEGDILVGQPVRARTGTR